MRTFFGLLLGAFGLALPGVEPALFNFDPAMTSPGPGRLPAGWTLSTTPTMTFGPDADAPPGSVFSGSMLVDWSRTVPDDQGNFFLSDFLPVDPEFTYRQRAWLKTEGKTANGMGVSLGRIFYDGERREIPFADYDDRYFVRNAGPEEWTLLTQELRPAASPTGFGKDEIPARARYVRLLFQPYGYYGKKFKITGIEFKPQVPGASRENPADGVRATIGAVGAAPIRLDGALDEECWRAADGWQQNFHRVCCPPERSTPVAAQTAFKFVEDPEYLYFAGRCESAANLISQPRPLNDPLLPGDEDLEIFLDAGGGRDRILQLCVNPDGSIAAWFNRAPANLSVQSAARKHASGWTVELAIPKSKLWQYYSEAGREINSGLWNLNVCRHQPGAAPEERYSAWNYSGEGFYNPDAMGVILRDTPRSVLHRELAAAAAAVDHRRPSLPPPEAGQPVALNRIARDLAALARLPGYLDDDLARAEGEISPALFASHCNEIRRIPAAMDKLLREYERLDFRFPADRIPYGCFVFTAPLCAPVDATVLPDAAQPLRELRWRAARAEITEQRFRLFVKEQLQNIRIDWNGLCDGNDREILPREALDVRILEPWGQNHQADILATDLRIPFQGYLENYSRAERFLPVIPADSTRDLMLLVRVGRDTAAGEYRGTVTITPEGKEPTVLPVTLEVLPFKLAASDKDLGFFSNSVLYDPAGDAIGGPGAMFYNGLDTEAGFRAHVRQILDFGFNYLLLCDYQSGPLNPEYTDRLLRLAAAEHLRKVALLGSEHIITGALLKPGQEELLARQRTILGERIAHAVRTARDLGFETCYIFGFDEPVTPEDVEINNIIFELAKENDAQTTVACIFDALRSQIRNMDAVSMNYLAMTSGNSELLTGPDAHGTRRLYYANFTNDYLTGSRLTFGWYLEKSGFDGNIPWALYYLGLEWEPFIDFAQKGSLALTNATYVFPTRDEPIPTLKFIAAHAGVSDLRYIETLKQQIARNPGGAAEQQAQARLDAMLANFDLRNDQGLESRNLKLAPERYDQLRAELQDSILNLLRAREP